VDACDTNERDQRAGNPIPSAFHQKQRGYGQLTTGQAAARLRISPTRCEALLRLWGVEFRGDRLVVTTELFGRLQRAVRER